MGHLPRLDNLTIPFPCAFPTPVLESISFTLLQTHEAESHGQARPHGSACPLALAPLYSQDEHVTGRKGELMPMEQINEQHPHRGDWLREIVFGLNDGLVTTLVFIMAVSEIAPTRLLLVALGEVLAGGVSMALGGYLAARTARQILDQRIATERYEIEHEPEEERAELRAIYRNKGLSGPLLDRVVGHLTADRERWHRAMVHDELGVVEDTNINPWLEGVQIGISFVVGGLIPTMPLLF
ncbi:MAG TPA: VIT1/CCC1 transporter family protein, partial [Ktedonobacteraceae bacterium]